MNNKSKVQNPLTIIAIFAGIAEIAGTGVLLGLPLEIQSTFIWFVMLFPVGLVTAFFLVLLFKHNVLYAPSDFVDENNFMNLLQNKKVQHELIEVVDLLEQVKESNTANDHLKQTLNEAMLKLENAKQNNEMSSNKIINSEKFIKNYYYDLATEEAIVDILQKRINGISLSELSLELNIGLNVTKGHVSRLIDKGRVMKEDGKYILT
ncbi:hypothetical protein Q9R46_14630 [Paenibacillus sp. RRE4]|uniref:hypothetical protein n=1 Tax=Paenibacillus sp. RRE4 TaxID=2962587 RepID=UPI00288233FB|nr:hypothetical protein [Paenibacillus sp. RRE4]MDT0123894.1 hypothetical protein [Paenibacillus sp. RRE4]